MAKILMYIDHHYGGGAQRVMSNLANYFSTHGAEVVFVVDVNDENKIRKMYPDAVEYPLDLGIKVISLEEKNTEKITASNWSRIKSLRNIIKKEKPYVVLSFLGRVNIRMLIASTGLSVKKCVSVRNSPEHEYGGGPVIKLLTNTIFLLANKYVFQTQDAKKWFFKSIQNKSRVIYNPVADAFFETQWVGGTNDIVTLGRLDKAKNHKLLIDAFEIVSKKLPDVSLKIYGTGSLRESLQNRIDEKNLTNRVSLCGPTRDVAKVLQSASVFVLSSDYEGMPNALMEAMAVGVPCVSTDCDVGGPRALFGDALMNYLVPCGDVDAMADAICRVHNEKDAVHLSETIKSRAELFRAEKIYKQWESYLFDKNGDYIYV